MYPYIKVLNLTIPSYGLCICVALLLCVAMIFKKADKNNMNFNNLVILIAVSIGCGILGGIILYIFVTYDFEMLCEQIMLGNISFLVNPGLVFYGGLLGGIAGGTIAALFLNIRIEDIESCVVPYIPLGHAVGRIGCFLAGCCHGFLYNGILAVPSIIDDKTYFPLQLIEAFFNILIMTVLLFYTKKERSRYSVLFLYLIMYSFVRFFLEFFRGDDIRGFLICLSTSQWISLVIFFFSLTVWLVQYRSRFAHR
ncbi:MAG: prolipoprotein diacylglyceryl transferase [Clostridia bacterium]|nr:prolipoprotein diacylglyceryl transferase [Clostridia bacterium]